MQKTTYSADINSFFFEFFTDLVYFFNGAVEHFLFVKVAVLDLLIVVVFGVLAEHSLNAKTVAVLKRFSKEIVPSVVFIRHIQQYVYQSQFFFLCCGVGIVAC